MEQTILSVENILAEAVEIAPADRQAFVEKACGGNAELRAKVERLLANHDQAGSFLEHPAAVLDTVALPANLVAVGARVGPYKLLEIIGEGGMGVVFLAEQQEPVRRQVALKVIKPGMDSKQIVARFEAERQALALMDHPNIAKVLDAGAIDTGRPYFVMELVHGIAITDYCDQARLTVRQRLDVFMQVCRAVQHAHTKGVIHRDLKPSNVLVTSDDGVPVPKVIDFGVAKALEQPLTERTLHTGFAQMVGTPLYMSPEQAEFNLRGVDTRSDIYSLGVLLYELLTGATPFDKERLRAVDFDELRRILREEEPPRPSTRVSTLGAALSTVSERRGVDARKLRDTLHGELDWIVLKALEKDRERRYDTASAFAADVQRYLNDEQVEACPPSAAYRLRKFVRRNKVALVTSGLVAAALLIGTAVSAWQTSEAIAARQLADDRLESEKKAHRDADEQHKRAELALKDAKFNLENAEVNLDLALEALDAVYMKEIEQRSRREQQLTPANKEFLQRGLSFYEKLAKSNSGSTGLQRETAKANRRIGFLHLNVFGKREEAEVAFRKAIPLFESLLERSPGVVDYRSELGDCQLGLAKSLATGGAKQEAEKLFRQALAVREKLADEFPRDPDRRAGLADCLARLGFLLKQPKAEEPLRRALNIFEQLSAEFPQESWYRREMAGIHQMKAIWLADSGQAREAQPHYQKARDLWVGLVAASPKDFFLRQELALFLLFHGRFLQGDGKLKDAEEVFQKSLEHHQQLMAEEPTNENIVHRTAQVHLHLASLFRVTKRPSDAEKAMRSSLDIWSKTIGIGPMRDTIGGLDLARIYQELARMVRANGKLAAEKEVYQDAEQTLRKLVATFPDSLARNPTPENRKRIIDSYLGLTEILRLNGKDEEAIAVNQEALRLIPDDPQARKNLDAAIEQKAKWEEALAAFREALRNPTDVTLWPALDGTLKNKVTLDELAAAYKEALRLHPRLAVTQADGAGTKQKEFSALVNLGRDLARFPEKKTDSFRAFKAALDLEADLAAEGLNEVLMHALQGRASASIVAYEAALRELGAQIRETHISFGDALMRHKDYEEVITQYKKALGVESVDRGKRWNPDAYWIHRELGYAYIQLGKPDEAIAACRAAVKLKPKESEAHLRLGMALQKKGRYQESVAACREALRIQPDRHGALNNLSWYLATCPDIKLRDPAEAVELAQKAVRLKPNEGYYWNTLGTARYRTGDWKAAITDLETSMKLRKGGDANDWFFLAMSHWQLGDKEQAAKYYQQAVTWMDKHAPQDAELLRFRAEAAELLGIKGKTNQP